MYMYMCNTIYTYTYIIICYVMLCYAMPCYIVVYHVRLCCIMLHYVVCAGTTEHGDGEISIWGFDYSFRKTNLDCLKYVLPER